MYATWHNDGITILAHIVLPGAVNTLCGRREDITWDSLLSMDDSDVLDIEPCPVCANQAQGLVMPEDPQAWEFQKANSSLKRFRATVFNAEIIEIVYPGLKPQYYFRQGFVDSPVLWNSPQKAAIAFLLATTHDDLLEEFVKDVK